VTPSAQPVMRSRGPEHPVLALQRQIGNAATARLLQRVIYKDEKAKGEGGAY
jgi:hypothetical protein